jgi:hypothetical protein
MSVLYRQSIYEDKIVTQSLNVANMFLTSSNAKYWAGKNNHHGVIISFDWMPSSGSLKLLEANTNIEITSQHANNNWNADFSQSIGLSPTSKKFDMDAMATYISESGHTSIVHVTRNVTGWAQLPHPNVLTKFNTILSDYGITSSSKYEVAYGQDIPDFDLPDTTFILRYAWDPVGEIDDVTENRDTFNNLISSSGYSSYTPQLTGSWTTDFVGNEDGVPDIVIKQDFSFGSQGTEIYDVTPSTSASLSSSYSYVEKYYQPDVNHLDATMEVRGVVMMTPTKNIMVSQVPEYTGGDQWLNHQYLVSSSNDNERIEYSYGNRKMFQNKFVILSGDKILSSSNQWVDIEDVTIGDTLVSYDTGSSSKGTTTIKDMELIQWGGDYLINNTYKFMSGSRVYNSPNESSGWSFTQIQDVNTGTYILSSSLDAIEVSSSVARTEDTANYWGDRIGWVIDVEPSDHYFVGEVLVHDNI